MVRRDENFWYFQFTQNFFVYARKMSPELLKPTEWLSSSNIHLLQRLSIGAFE